jgi:ABC-type antimicrobial peptide transport system permease subunit
VGITVIVIIFAVVLIVRERATEIGTLKALGASHWQVIRQFVLEVITYSSLASGLGILMLISFGPRLAEMFSPVSPSASTNMPASNGGMVFMQSAAPTMEVSHLSVNLSWQNLLIIAAIGLLVAIFASVIPAFSVAQIRPAEVLRKGQL